MKLKLFAWEHRRWVGAQRNWNRPQHRRVLSNQGLTLVELLVASLLTSVVILVTWSGLISVMNMSQVAEAKTARQAELYKALDFMTSEIRMARSINETATQKANGTTVTVEDVVTSSGLNLANLGSYGTIALYLERPTSGNVPIICPLGGPNGGAAPPAPADYDRIVYDIRPSPSGWLSPRILMRYGRVPAADDTINPCSNPISSDPMVDALSTTASEPTCSGVVSGDGGFYACVNDNQAELYFQSDITKTATKRISSSVASRVLMVTPPTEITLTMEPLPSNPQEFTLTYLWPKVGPSPSYKLYEREQEVEKIVASGSSVSYKGQYDGPQRCYWLEGQSGTSQRAKSNEACTNTLPQKDDGDD